MTKEFAHEADARRYTLRIDGTLAAIVDYTATPEVISFTRTFTHPAHRGKGHAAEITAFAVDDVESTTTAKIVPMCWYTGKWFEENPERAGLLTRGSA